MTRFLMIAAVVLWSGGTLAAQDTPEEKADAAGGGDVASLKAKVAELEKHIMALQNANSALSDRISDTEMKLKEVGKGGGAGFDILGNMQSDPKFQNAFFKATSGRLVLINSTGSSQYLNVNGTLWRVVTGKSYLMVPRGPVVVQRPGGSQETLTKWQFNKASGFVVLYDYSTGELTPTAAEPATTSAKAALAPVVIVPR